MDSYEKSKYEDEIRELKKEKETSFFDGFMAGFILVAVIFAIWFLAVPVAKGGMVMNTATFAGSGVADLQVDNTDKANSTHWGEYRPVAYKLFTTEGVVMSGVLLATDDENTLYPSVRIPD